MATTTSIRPATKEGERRLRRPDRVVLAHKFPDFVGALITPVVFVVVMFIFDWAMGLACLVPIAVSFACIWRMMGGGGSDENSSYLTFVSNYQQALNRMNAAATEYVRGMPVVKVFQQTVDSFNAFKEAILQYRDMAHGYSKLCEKPQVVQIVAINSTFAVLVPASILLAGAAGTSRRSSRTSSSTWCSAR